MESTEWVRIGLATAQAGAAVVMAWYAISNGKTAKASAAERETRFMRVLQCLVLTGCIRPGDLNVSTDIVNNIKVWLRGNGQGLPEEWHKIPPTR